MTNLYIPSKIKVGFQERSDTFTGKLAYVIYFDEKGKLRKETSWEGWRDSKIEPIEIENKPNSGYLFNKGVQRGGYDWGTGRSSIRVYDPRDFEFEITVDNLMGILMHSDVSKRDIVEECVFAWEGKELVLLPVNSEEYQKSVKYTEKQSGKLSAKSLVKGYTYNHKKIDELLVYVGNFEWFEWGHLENGKKTRYSGKYTHYSTGKKHVFYNVETKEFSTPAISSFSGVNTEQVVEDYATIVDEFFSTIHSQPIVGVKSSPLKEIDGETLYQTYRVVDNKVEHFRFGYYSYYFENKDDATVDLSNVDYNLTKYELSFKNRTTEQIDRGQSDSYYSYHNRNRKPGEVEVKINTIVSDLGLDIKKLKLEDAIKVVTLAGFGELTLVLENGKTCSKSKVNYYL